MVESYQKIMNPPEGVIGNLIKETSDPQIKWKTLDEARNRAEWERGKRKREGEKQKERDEEAEAMALIDWQDFVVVETIEFTQNDMELELPPPTNVEKLKTMSLAEKRMASMVMEETGAGPTAMGNDDNDAVEEMDMEEDDDEDAKLQKIKEEQEQARAKEVQRAAMQSRGVKIRTDYTPKGRSFLALHSAEGERSVKADISLRYSTRWRSAYCQMSKLWSIDPRKRTFRTHAYRAPRP